MAHIFWKKKLWSTGNPIIFGTQTSSLNTWLSEAKSLLFRYLPNKIKNENNEQYKEDSTRRVIVHEVAALGT